MDAVLTWLNAYWWVVLLILGALIKALNVITYHWSHYTGLARWCMFLVDLLDVIKSTPPTPPKTGGGK